MALQGTIDSFPLVDVLALLEASSKTGRLELVGDRGRGTLWVDGGQMVAAEVHGTTDVEPTDAVWELLRFNDGSFEFDAGGQAAEPSYSADISRTVEAARKMLAEWERITERVPGLEHTVELAPRLPGEDVRLSAEDWAVLVATGHSRSVGAVLHDLGAGEFAGSAKLAELVDRSLVLVSAPAAPGPDSRRPDPLTDSVQEVAEEPVEDVPPAESFPEVSPEAVQPEHAEAEPVLEPATTTDPATGQDPAPESAAAPVERAAARGHVPELAAAAQQEAPQQGTWHQETWHQETAQQDEMARGAVQEGGERFPEHFPIDDLVSDEEGVGWEQAVGPDTGAAGTDQVREGAAAQPAAEQAAAAQVPAQAPQQAPAADPFAAMNGSAADEDATDDVLSQISRLSPKAAEAIAAALGDGEENV